MMWQLDGYNSYLPLGSAAIIAIIMVHTLYESKRGMFTRVIVWVSCIAVIAVAEHYIRMWINNVTYETMAILLSFLFLIAYQILFIQIPWQQRIFTFIFINNTLYLILLLSRTVTLLFGKNLNIYSADQLFLTIYLIVVSFFAISFALELREVVIRCLDVYVQKINSMLIFALLNYVGVLILAPVWQPWYMPDYENFFKYVAILSIEICGYILAFTSLTSLGDKLVSESEAKVAKEQLILSEKYYDSIVDNVQKTRIYNHNIRHFANAVVALANKRDFDELSKFAEELQTDLPESMPIWSHVTEIDAVISSCAEFCSRENIEFKCEFMLPRNIGIETLHMCIILGNCLQNAIDACCRMKSGKERFIRLFCFPASDKLVLQVENSFDGMIHVHKDGTLISRKENDKELHGFGVQSIQHTAEKYHGNCAWEIDENVFRMNVLMSIQ